MRQRFDRLRRLLGDSLSQLWIELAYTDAFMAWVAMVFGLWFLFHPTIFSKPSMAPFSDLGPRGFWAMWFVSLSLAQFYALATMHHAARRLSSAYGFLSWMTTAAHLYQISDSAIGIAMTTCFAAACASSHLRAGPGRRRR